MYQIEQKTRFSKSHIWQLQRDYFEASGIDAWRTGDVPHYITSNPVMGKTYAELVLAFLRDLALKGQTNETVYLLELGAGHGRLCYHFFKHFEKFYESSSIKLPPFCFILSDFTDSNLEFWRGHPRLNPYVEKGWLDFALFDAEKSTELSLKNTGITIRSGELSQPLIVLANYFFDSIPQDLFLIQDREISNCFLELSSEKDPEHLITADLIEQLTLEYDYEKAPSPIYPDQPILDKLLDDYRDTFISTHLLFPHVGIACIERLQKLSNSGLFLLTADKGEHHLSNLDAFPAPSLSSHGSFSFNVNYHVLKQYCIEKGGIPHFPNQQQSSLDLGCLLFLEDAQSYQETHHAYERFVQNFGPDDYFSMKKFAELHFDEMSFRDILAILRLSGYDGKIFWQMLPRLYKLVPVLQENERWNIFLTVPRVWDTYFPLGEPADLASELGKLLMDLDYFEEALVYFEKSILIYGKTSEVQYEVALCYCLSGSFENAAPIIAELMTIDPENEALQMLLTDFDPSLAENTEG